jgi:hypothetical protein
MLLPHEKTCAGGRDYASGRCDSGAGEDTSNLKNLDQMMGGEGYVGGVSL